MLAILVGFVLTPLAILAAVRFLDGPAPGVPSRPGFAGWLAQSKTWHALIAVGLSALVFLSTFDHHGEGMILALFVTALVFLAVMIRAWQHQVLFLMSLRDDDFPGQRDKLIWAAFLFVMPPVGLWLFRSYREGRWPEPEPTGKVSPARDWI